MNIDKQALREAAEKATGGKYVVGHNNINRYGNVISVFVCQEWEGGAGGVVAECHVNCLTKNSDQVYANAKFIAVASPATMLALVDEMEAAEKRIAETNRCNTALAAKIEPMDRQVDELTMWVKRLVHSLRNAKPDSKLHSDAMDYLSRNGLISVEDVLR